MNSRSRRTHPTAASRSRAWSAHQPKDSSSAARIAHRKAVRASARRPWAVSISPRRRSGRHRSWVVLTAWCEVDCVDEKALRLLEVPQVVQRRRSHNGQCAAHLVCGALRLRKRGGLAPSCEGCVGIGASSQRPRKRRVKGRQARRLSGDEHRATSSWSRRLAASTFPAWVSARANSPLVAHRREQSPDHPPNGHEPTCR